MKRIWICPQQSQAYLQTPLVIWSFSCQLVYFINIKHNFEKSEEGLKDGALNCTVAALLKAETFFFSLLLLF